MSFISPVHIAFFAAIALLALGPKRFPEFTKTLGHTLREFREVMSGATAAAPVDRGDAAQPAVAAAPVPAPPPASAD
ncbi:MAG TPA: twin-arginine translocase TatA/TatE family subunit [Solirubrobacteraceae bacterium]|jgi:Sec-independent protein translocase protein TatA|nr:twin-arginine translocase TatA/TatE family subunit [Solirubrobacteraceae bacterium]